MFFTYTEFNDLKVNNNPISDELLPKGGFSTEVSEHAKKHRDRSRINEMLDEDYTALLTAGAVGAMSVMAVLGLIPATNTPVTPTKPIVVNSFEVKYNGNNCELSFGLENIVNGNTILSILDNESKKEFYGEDNLKNTYYHYVFSLESGKEYNGSIFNIVDNTKTVIKTFSLTVGL